MSNPSKPCKHTEPRPNECRACWLFENDERYKKLWGEKPVSGPPLLRRAVNFLSATIQHAMAGLPIVSDAQAEERLSICRSNECGQYRDDSCMKCGCNLPLKAKWAEQKCPEGRWVYSLDTVTERDTGNGG